MASGEGPNLSRICGYHRSLFPAAVLNQSRLALMDAKTYLYSFYWMKKMHIGVLTSGRFKESAEEKRALYNGNIRPAAVHRHIRCFYSTAELDLWPIIAMFMIKKSSKLQAEHD